VRGRYHWNKRTEEGMKKGIEHFRQAIERDPDYPLPYVGLADSYMLLSYYRHLVPGVAYPKAKRAVLKALAIDDAIGEAHASLALIKLQYDWDWSAADREFRRALELAPNYATGHQWYAFYLVAMGRMDAALAEITRARELDPLSLIISADFGLYLYYTRRFDQAQEQLKKTLELNPDFLPAHYELGMVYAQQARFGEAFEELNTAKSLSRGAPAVLARLGYVHAMAGQRDEALRIVEEVKTYSEERYVAPFDLAVIYVGLGDTEQASTWLDRAFEDRSGPLPYLGVEPIFDPMRSDSRFQVLARRMRLEGVSSGRGSAESRRR
jgi:tetratricopeptide (TPR) repeat protein